MIARALPAFLALLLSAFFPAAAAAQSALDVVINEAVLEDDGQTRLTVSVTGEGLGDQVLDSSAFTVSEAGAAVPRVGVTPILTSEEIPVSVLLVVDVSGSTAGEPLAAAKAAASSFAQRLLQDGVVVGVVAFGEQAELVVPPTADAGGVVSGIAGLQAGGETALYDGIVLASETLAGRDGLRRMVVFSDGGDTVSSATSDAAILAASEAETPVTVVALETAEFDPASLAGLADGTSGRVVPVAATADLGAAFESVAREIASQYVIEYRSDVTTPEELPITVEVQIEGLAGAAEIVALNGRDPVAVGPAVEPPSAEIPQPRVEALASETGLLIGLATAGTAVLLLLVALLWRPGNPRVARTLSEGLRAYGKERSGKDEVTLPTADLTERAIELVGRLPKPAGFEERLQTRLDRSAWPIRVNEFVVLCVASAVLGAVLGFGLSGSLILAVLGLVVGGGVPMAVLQIRIDRRKRAFEEQLPATLQLLAGSLQAGYGLLQAIDTVIQEIDPPMSEEFSRVLTEARLGMSIDEAMENMAERVGSEDFRWVVLATTIQRQVGGNLAELLGTVAATMRSRAQVRRQVKVLSAEGRISAWVIGVMPFFVAGALSILNPGYLNQLLTATLGKIMLAAAAGLLVVGVLWIRKIIQIDV